jgi:hypothetical protein
MRHTLEASSTRRDFAMGDGAESELGCVSGDEVCEVVMAYVDVHRTTSSWDGCDSADESVC